MRRLYGFFFIICLLLLCSMPVSSQTVKILFDASQAETAGNADWVIDANSHNLGFGTGPAVLNGGNESNAQQIPSPAQSGITGSTSETYWSGALSYWGIDCVNQNYTVESLPYNGQITYGNSSNAQDLSNYEVFIVCEPNILFTASEKTAILNFVQNGGGLFMISDHDVSDRNNDGKDSPFIWNDLMSNNSVQVNPFGMTFDYANFSQTSTNIPSLPGDSILHGSFGNVTAVQWSNGTTITLSPSQNSSVKGVVYKSGSSFGNNNVMCAYARYGNGKVAAIGDSSPCDDGSGDPNDNLYDGYIADASGNHRKLLMNMTIWLATPNSSAPPVADFTGSPLSICTGQSTTFTDNSIVGGTSYSWNFGSGASPATASTVGPHAVTYSSAGLKTISLTVTNANGSNTKTRTNYITVNSNCLSQDVGVVALLSPDLATCPIAANPLQVQVQNFGPTSISFSTNPLDVVMNISDPSSSLRVFTKTINSGTLSAGATIDVTLDSTYDLISPGNYIFNAYTVFAPDVNSANDAMAASTVTVSPGFESDYTVFSENMGTVSATTAISVHEANDGFENIGLTMTGTGDVRITQNSLGTYSGASGGANIYLAPIAGRYFTISGINTSSFSNLQLSLGFYKNTASSTITDFKVQVSSDGTIFSDLTLPALPAGAAWNYITVSGSIPSVPDLSIRFLQNGTINQYRVDDVSLIEKIVLPGITTLDPTTFCQGDSAILSAGSNATSYLWSNEMTTQSITVSIGGNYSVTETNASGCAATSAPITITVVPSVAADVSISASPSNSICSGTIVTFTASPTNGGTTPVYQWKVNGTNVGINSTSYTSSALSNGQLVSCEMTSNATCASPGLAISNSIPMTVSTASSASVVISQTAGTNPQCAGASATFTAVPTNGGTTPAYQWKVNGTNAGTNSASYTTSALTNGQIVSCVMTSNAACVTGSPATSNTITITVNSNVAASVVISQTAGTNPQCAGASVTFTAVPTNGGTTPAYQWKVNGTNVGTNSASYTTSALTNGQIVSCVMTSNAVCVTGSPATSNSITMTVNSSVTASVVISQTAGTNPQCAGASATFTAVPTNGGTTPAYQWKINGTNVGTNSASYTTSALTNGQIVSCVMTSNAVCVTGSPATSNTITITVNSNVAASVALSQTAGTNPQCAGASATFTAVPTNGGTTPAYQWKVNGTNVGTNSASYTTSALTNGQIVSCVMTSNAACVTGSPATSNSITMTVNSSVTASVVISQTAGTNPQCAGASATFTAVPTNGGTTPAYQWKVNGTNVGTNSASYTTSALTNGQIVSCVMTSNAACVTGSPAASNSVTMLVNNPPSISSFTPAGGSSGTSVAISGSGFTGTTSVKFNGMLSTFAVNSDVLITATAPVGASTGLLSVTTPCGTANSGSNFITNVLLNLKVFIEGFYLGAGIMKAVVDPLNQPTLCDSISVELRNSFSPFGIAQSVKNTINIYGNGNFVFPGSIQGQSYYIVIRHRNSLETWSSVPILFNGPVVNYNFSDGLNRAFGNNLKDVSVGNYAIFSGDVNQDGSISLNDLSETENACLLFLTGYLPEDLTGDLITESSDYSLLENNLGRILNRP